MWKKCVEKVRGSLTVRIFLITTVILSAACSATYGLLAWVTPATYVTIVTNDLKEQTDLLVSELAQTEFNKSGPLLDRFVLAFADVMITGPDGKVAATPATMTTKGVFETEDVVVVSTKTGVFETEDIAVSNTADEETQVQVGVESQTDTAKVSTTVMTEALVVKFAFPDREGEYTLHVSPRTEAATNQVLMALWKVAPVLVTVLLAFSFFCAWFYSRYITHPIVRLSGISQQMADLEFTWQCDETRPDEIGQLGRNLDTLAVRLSAALLELRTTNEALQRDINRERALEQQRTTFFSAASHELKTPVTILKGQLSGMLAGVDVYQDRDRYLARSLAVTNRMEGLVQEILAVSRMERSDFQLKQEPVDLSLLVTVQGNLLTELAEQREQTVMVTVAPGLTVTGDQSLLERAVSNLLNNASTHSPAGARIAVNLRGGDATVLTVENSGAAIPEDDLPHLFEAFYRVDHSRNRSTGGSGLGLYLVKMILDRHGADCRIENLPSGVRVTAVFSDNG